MVFAFAFDSCIMVALLFLVHGSIKMRVGPHAHHAGEGPTGPHRTRTSAVYVYRVRV